MISTLRRNLSMWMENDTPRLIAVLLVAGSLAGCATSSIKATDSAPSSSSSNEPLAAQSLTPSFASENPSVRDRGMGPQASDPQAAKAVDALASMSKPGTHSYRIGP